MKPTKTTLTVTILGDVELDAEIEYTYHRACKGARGDYGVPLEPDEPADVEIDSVTYNGHDISPLVKIDQIEEDILDDIANNPPNEPDWDAMAEDRAEAQADRDDRECERRFG